MRPTKLERDPLASSKMLVVIVLNPPIGWFKSYRSHGLRANGMKWCDLVHMGDFKPKVLERFRKGYLHVGQRFFAV